MKIVVLGATGMLGSMVYACLKNDTELDVVGTSRKKADSFIYYMSMKAQRN